MAIKAVVYVKQIFFDAGDAAGEFSVDVSFVGDSGLNIQTKYINKIAMNSVTNALLVAAIKNAVKMELIASYGYTFGLLDTVYVMNSNIL